MTRVRVTEADHVWLRSILEAYEGLVTWRMDPGGVFALTAPPGREAELDALLADLCREAPIVVLGD